MIREIPCSKCASVAAYSKNPGANPEILCSACGRTQADAEQLLREAGYTLFASNPSGEYPYTAESPGATQISSEPPVAGFTPQPWGGVLLQKGGAGGPTNLGPLPSATIHKGRGSGLKKALKTLLGCWF